LSNRMKRFVFFSHERSEHPTRHAKPMWDLIL
jgi:hypothetical protein